MVFGILILRTILINNDPKNSLFIEFLELRVFKYSGYFIIIITTFIVEDSTKKVILMEYVRASFSPFMVDFAEGFYYGYYKTSFDIMIKYKKLEFFIKFY